MNEKESSTGEKGTRDIKAKLVLEHEKEIDFLTFRILDSFDGQLSHCKKKIIQ